MFFAPEAALNLAAARVIFAANSLWVLLSRDLPANSALPPEFWASTDNFDRWRFLIFPGHPQLEYLVQGIAIVSLCAAIVGVMPRLACFVAGISLYHLAPLETVFWFRNPYERGFTIAVAALVTLSFSRCGDRLRLFGSSRRESDPSPAYCWALRLSQLYLAEVYLFSGITKLQRAGLRWATAGNLRDWFMLFNEQWQVRVYATLGPWIANHWLACLLAGWAGLLFDLGFIVAVFSRRARWVLVPAAVIFHVLVKLTMSITFLNIPQLLIFVNWQWIEDRLKREPVQSAESLPCAASPR